MKLACCLRDTPHLRLEVALRLPHIVIGLHRVPGAGSSIECDGQSEVHVGTDTGRAVEQARECNARNAETLGRIGYTDPREPLAQNFAGMGGGLCIGILISFSDNPDSQPTRHPCLQT